MTNESAPANRIPSSEPVDIPPAVPAVVARVLPQRRVPLAPTTIAPAKDAAGLSALPQSSHTSQPVSLPPLGHMQQRMRESSDGAAVTGAT